jgi:hypothetical protein
MIAFLELEASIETSVWFPTQRIIPKEGSMKQKMKGMLAGIMVLFFYGSTLTVFCETSSPVEPILGENPQGMEWGMSLSQFKTAAKSILTYSVDPMEARAMDYLLMDSHAVGKDDPARFPGFASRIPDGGQTIYVFYRGSLCLTAEPIPLMGLQGEQRLLESKYKRLKSELRPAGEDFYDSYGAIRTFYRFETFAESPDTLICLVKVSGYYENQLYYDKGYDIIASGFGELMKSYLIRLSADYLKGVNAYTDWLGDKKTSQTPGNKTDFLLSLKCSIEH